MNALTNRQHDGHQMGKEEEDNQRVPGKEIQEKKWKEQASCRQINVELDEEEWSGTRIKSTKPSCSFSQSVRYL